MIIEAMVNLVMIFLWLMRTEHVMGHFAILCLCFVFMLLVEIGCTLACGQYLKEMDIHTDPLGNQSENYLTMLNS